MADVAAKLARCEMLMDRARRAQQVIDNAKRDMNRAVACLTAEEMEAFNKLRKNCPELVQHEDYQTGEKAEVCIDDRSFGDCMC
jgi:hypothetical protein